MWDLPGPGLEPVSPALAGGFLTTAPPGKSLKRVHIISFQLHDILEQAKLWISTVARGCGGVGRDE